MTKSKHTPKERAVKAAIKAIIGEYKAELATERLIMSLTQNEVNEARKSLKKAKENLKYLENANNTGKSFLKAKKNVEHLQERMEDAETAL